MQSAETGPELQVRLLDAFVQNQRYIACWQENHCHFHLAAALWGGLWCFFRKLWWLGMLVCLADAAIIGAIRHLLTTGKLDRFTSLPPACFLLLCLLGLVRLPLGSVAHSIYRAYCKASLAAMLENAHPDAFLFELAKRRGGTSVQALVVGLVLQIVSIGLSISISDAL